MANWAATSPRMRSTRRRTWASSKASQDDRAVARRGGGDRQLSAGFPPTDGGRCTASVEGETRVGMAKKRTDPLPALAPRAGRIWLHCKSVPDDVAWWRGTVSSPLGSVTVINEKRSKRSNTGFTLVPCVVAPNKGQATHSKPGPQGRRVPACHTPPSVQGRLRPGTQANVVREAGIPPAGF